MNSNLGPIHYSISLLSCIFSALCSIARNISFFHSFILLFFYSLLFFFFVDVVAGYNEFFMKICVLFIRGFMVGVAIVVCCVFLLISFWNFLIMSNCVNDSKPKQNSMRLNKEDEEKKLAHSIMWTMAASLWYGMESTGR